MNLQINATPVPDLVAVVQALGCRMSDYDWHLADIDTNPHRDDLAGGWVTGDALHTALTHADIQFKWGVVDAVPKGFRCPVDDAPWADGNAGLWVVGAAPQMSCAVFEIVFFDSSTVLLYGLNAEHVASATAAFGVGNVSATLA